MTTILLADDRRESLAAIETRLQSKGFIVVTATNGKQVLEVMGAEAIDAVVIDMHMPEMDGCETTELLKSSQITKQIPVIIFTAHPLPGDEQRAKASGCDGFLAKPIDFKDLLQMLSRLLHETYDSAQPELPESDASAISDSKSG